MRCRHKHTAEKHGECTYDEHGFIVYGVEFRECLDCGAWLPLGPARDDDERVQTELYALEMLVWAGDIGSKNRREILNSGDICGAGCVYCEGSYLACAIAEHPTGADQ